ncbi:hypothetical protein [Burkholderia sp. BE17]|uniref:hypothetical protein n=1 Tax=Burkholderia sp. BE17 TaxID=2656644 RepID=UPI00128DB0D1|nr:hypothetical protein [Burkholderia sp. BE17]MPV65532.1 hypothetical protein [Burkholderia sp. BE17]
MVLRRSAHLPARVTRRDTLGRTLLDALGQPARVNAGAAGFTLAPCSSDACSPLELGRLQDQLQAGVPSGAQAGRIGPDVGPGGARGYRLAPDTWTSVSPKGTSCGAQRPHPGSVRAAKQAALEAAEPRERERVLGHAKIRDAIALLERHSYCVIGPDAGAPSDG